MCYARLLMNIVKAPFYYIRHGETDWNAQNKAMGQADIPLNANGISQALSARKRLVGCKIASICHSPLSRAKQTAELINQVLSVPLIEVENLREFDLGPYQGTIKEQWFQDWRKGHILPGTESYEGFIDRALRGIAEALTAIGPVLIVAHGGVYWALEQLVQSGKKEIPNCTPLFCTPLTEGRWKSIFID